MRQTNRLSTHRVLLLGDAAAYGEPFTGEGIGWALSSALATAPIVLRVIWRIGIETRSTIGKRAKSAKFRGQTVCKALAFLLRKPMAVQLALRAINAVPVLARPLVQRVH